MTRSGAIGDNVNARGTTAQRAGSGRFQGRGWLTTLCFLLALGGYGAGSTMGQSVNVVLNEDDSIDFIFNGTEDDEHIVVRLLTVPEGFVIPGDPDAEPPVEPVPEEDTLALQVEVYSPGDDPATDDPIWVLLDIEGLGVDSPDLLIPIDALESVTINGADGDDFIDLRPVPAERDFILTANGGRGNDLILGSAGDDFLNAGRFEADSGAEGTNLIYGGLGDDVITGSGGNDILIGGPQAVADCGETTDNDLILGVAGSNLLVAGACEDRLVGGSGNDVLVGGLGNHTLIGGGGFNLLDYSRLGFNLNINLPQVTATFDEFTHRLGGDDAISSSFQAVRGGPGDDTIIGNENRQTVILGGPGNDTIRTGLFSDMVLGQTGEDNILGCDPALAELFNARYRRPDLDDMVCSVHASGNFLFGNAGDDSIRGASGGDVIFGGGDDIPVSELQGVTDAENTQYGIVAWWHEAEYAEPGDVGGFLWNRPNDEVPDYEIGQPCDPTLSVLTAAWECDLSDPANPKNPRLQNIRMFYLEPRVPRWPVGTVLSGVEMPGEDTLGIWRTDTGAGPTREITQLITNINPALGPVAPGGDDTIIGGGGSNLLVGGPGSNDICAGDVPSCNLRDMSLTQRLQMNAGGEGANIIFGKLHMMVGETPLSPGPSGSDWIIGSDGDDVIVGGAGADWIHGKDGDDIIWGDFIYDFETTTGAKFTSRTLRNGIFDADPEGPSRPVSASDTIYGGAGDDRIYGGPGNDILVGGPGDDMIQGNSGDNRIYGGSRPGDPGGYLDDGFDTLDYSSAPLGVIVDLGEFSFSDAPEAGFALRNGWQTEFGFFYEDIFIQGIQNVIGTDQDDVIFGTGDYNSDKTGTTIIIDGDVVISSAINSVTIPVVTDGTFGERTFTGLYDNILIGRGGNDIIMGRGGENLIVGGPGDDILCGDTDPRCVPDNLAALYAETIVNIPGIERLGQADFIIGGPGNDQLYGNGGDDIIRGGTGNNILSGGTGWPVLDYSRPDRLATGQAWSRVVVNLDPATNLDLVALEQDLKTQLGRTPLFIEDPDVPDLRQLVDHGCGENVQCAGTATNPGRPAFGIAPGLDTIINTPHDRFRVVLGTTGRDVIRGTDTHPTILIGWSGNDVLIGGNSMASLTDPETSVDDMIFGNAPPAEEERINLPADLVSISPGNNVIQGGLGHNFLDGGAVPSGPAGFGHVLMYRFATTGVRVDLSNTAPQKTVNLGTAGEAVDTIRRFRHLVGSDHDDVLIGNNQNNTIFGALGNDRLAGGPGNNTLYGGPAVHPDDPDVEFENEADYRTNTFGIDPNAFSFGPHPTVSPGDPLAPAFIVTDNGQGGEDELFQIQIVLPPPSSLGTGGGQPGTVPAPVRVQVGQDQVLQAGGSTLLTFSVTGGVPPYTAKWDPITFRDATVTPVRNVTILNWDEETELEQGEEYAATAMPLETTTFRVTATDANGIVDEAFIKVTVAPVLAVNAGPNRTLQPGQTVTFAPIVTGGVQPYTYLWEAQTGDGGFVSSNMIARAEVSPSETTDYTLSVTDDLGTTGIDTVRVTVAGPGEDPTSGQQGIPVLDPGTQTAGDAPDDEGDDAGSSPGTVSHQPPATRSAPGLFPGCGAGTGAAFMAVNLLAFAVLRRRRWSVHGI